MRRSYINIMAGITLFVLIACLKLSAQPAFVKDSLDKYIEREMKRWDVPGLAVAIIKDGNIIVNKGYGWADLKNKKRVDENTLFHVASNSKAFTGTLAAWLQVEKKLSLDDKVIKWIPDFKMKEEYVTTHVTLADMLSHRIGFATFQSDFLNWNCSLSREELIANMRNVTPENDYRGKFGYCNMGFVVAGNIIKAAENGVSWDDQVKNKIFIPLGMSRSTTFYEGFINDNNACKPYTIYDGKITLVPAANVNSLGPAASISSSTTDLIKWIRMQIDKGMFDGKQVVPSEAIRLATTSNTITRDGGHTNGNHFNTYGLGWFLKDYHGRRVISHDGGADGFVTTTCFIPEEKLGIIVLTNSDANSLYDNLKNQIIDAYFDLPYKNRSEAAYKQYAKDRDEDDAKLKALKELADKRLKPALTLNGYCGVFENEVYGTVELKEVKGIIKISFSSHPKLSAELKPLGENKFLCIYNIPTYGIKELEFTLNKQGVESFILRVADFIDPFEYKFVRNPAAAK